MRTCKNRVLRIRYSLKSKKIVRVWRKLHNESLIAHTFHQILLGDKMVENQVDTLCSMHGRNEKRCRILIRKLEGKRPLGIWENDVEVDLEDI